MRKVKQRGGKYTMTSTDTSNGNLRIMGMSGRGMRGGSLYSTIRRNTPFVTPQVKQVGGSLYRSRYGQFGGDTSMFGKIWRG